MDLFAPAQAGIRSVRVEPALQDQALKYLHQWLTAPEFAPYRPQIEWLIRTEQWPGLLDRFYQILPFGTGGRRGAVGVGPNRMNLWTLGASVQGHCEYLKERFPGGEPLRVVIAYDVRRFEDKRRQYNPGLPNPVLHLSSRDLAHHAVAIYAANGIHAYTLPPDSSRYLATPELSFTIRTLAAHGGLNISASHNPPDDNGGKFYDERGGQPVPPDDQIMADLVDQVTDIRGAPAAERGTPEDPARSALRALRAAQHTGRVHFLDDAPHRAYIDLGRRQSLVPPPRFDEIKVVFTPLHGVGAMTALETLTHQGFRVTPVEEQMTPDGQFPNVTGTPNPELPASMDRALAVAQRHAADLVLSTDPDADRLGALIPISDLRLQIGDLKAPSSANLQSAISNLQFRFVTGNEIAALLTHFKLNKLSQQGQLPPSPIVIKTEVTTGLITRIARHFSAQVVENLLVGFKYIADVLWHLERDGAYEDVQGTPVDFVIACEESHGILLTPQVRDKDAAGAALLLAELALDQKRQGRTVEDYLDGLYRRFGYFDNQGVQVVMSGILGKQNMARMLNALRQSPPRDVAGLVVTSFEDLRDEHGRLGPLKGATDAAARNFLIFRFGDRARIVLRPSGTEPKAKAYVEVCTPPCPTGTPPETWQRTCRAADELCRHLAREFLTGALRLVGLDPEEAGIR
jgi:phosphoglucomutase/phosphomannomutase